MADSNQIIAAKLQVDTGNSNANIKEVKKNLTDVKGALNDASAAAKTTGKDIEGTGGSFGKIREQLAAVSPAGAAASEGVGKLSNAFKILLANPVVLVFTAIVGALALMYAAFKNSFEGGEKLEQVFAGIKAVAQSLLDNLDKIGSAIKNVFTFNFSGAVADIKAIGNAAATAYSQMADLTKQAQALHKEQLANDLDSAERAKRLAILREQASDDSIPPAKRKAALLELKKDAEQNAKDDIDLAKRTTENKIAQLTIQEDGAKKNQDEITKLKIEQINVETDNANELRRISKQVTAADKAEKAEQTANAKAAAEKQKAQREQLEAGNNTLLKIQQENSLLLIKGGYERELQQLENKFADEKKANAKAFADKKITREQYNAIEAAETTKADLQRDALTEKHNQEIATKEIAFEKELSAIRTKTRLANITDSRELERVQLDITAEQQLQDAIVRYKDDSDKLQEIKNAIDEQRKAAQEKLDAKNAKEDEKKKLETEQSKLAATLSDPAQSFDAKKAALDADVLANQEAFDQKAISEAEFTKNKAANVTARKALDKEELNSKLDIAGKIGDALGTLSELVGKQTVAGKAFAVAQASISAIQGAVNAFTSLSSIPIVGPALGAIAAAGAIAAGIANVKKIVAVQVPGGGGGGSVPSGLAIPAAPLAPTQATTKLDANSLNQIGNATSRAYVIDSDVANNRDRDSRLNRASRLG